MSRFDLSQVWRLLETKFRSIRRACVCQTLLIYHPPFDNGTDAGIRQTSLQFSLIALTHDGVLPLSESSPGFRSPLCWETRLRRPTFVSRTPHSLIRRSPLARSRACTLKTFLGVQLGDWESVFFLLLSAEYLSDAVLAHLIGYADSVLSMPVCHRDCNAGLLSWHTPFVCP